MRRKLISILACLLGAHNVSAFAAINTPINTKLFMIETPAFKNLTQIPIKYTCDDQDVSPMLSWKNIPEGATSLTLILEDPDAPRGTFYHWLLYNIPPSITTLAEGIHTLPLGVKVGKNSFGKKQYNGPCPPKGAEHRYIFTLYALDIELPLSDGASPEDLLNAIQNHVLGKAMVTGLFKH